MSLRIAKELELPLDAVTQTLAAIGRKGAGKTYLATLIAEQMLAARAQVVALDPVGNWWGLRVGADGKSKGKDIFVLGGEHGDVAITAEHGARIARFVVEKRVSAVLDVSAFRQGERKRFAADFGEELFHLQKKDRRALHLFVEEAQLFAPQRPGPDDARMLGAFEHIVRLGRNYGIGATLVTQRPQSVNKEVLSQVECLCVLQVTGPHERKALEEWVQEAGADRKLVGQLPGLGRGEGYVWSPAWLRRYERVRFAQKTTFDASATPEVGKAARAAELPTVDVEALRSDLAEVVEQAEKDDPKALRRRIAELQRELAKKPAPAPPAPRVIEKPVLKDAQVERLEALAAKLVTAAAEVTSAIGKARQAPPAVAPARPALVTRPAPPMPAGRFPHSGDAVRAARPREAPVDADDLTPAAVRMLEALARVHPERLSRTQLATLSGYNPNGGGFRNTLSALSSPGLVTKHGHHVALSDAGVARFRGHLPPPMSPEEVRGMWREKLAPAAWRMLQVLLERPTGMTRAELAEASGYELAGGGFRNTLSALSSNALIEKDGFLVRAAATLFDGGAA